MMKPAIFLFLLLTVTVSGQAQNLILPYSATDPKIKELTVESARDPDQYSVWIAKNIIGAWESSRWPAPKQDRRNPQVTWQSIRFTEGGTVQISYQLAGTSKTLEFTGSYRLIRNTIHGRRNPLNIMIQPIERNGRGSPPVNVLVGVEIGEFDFVPPGFPQLRFRDPAESDYLFEVGETVSGERMKRLQRRSFADQPTTMVVSISPAQLFNQLFGATAKWEPRVTSFGEGVWFRLGRGHDKASVNVSIGVFVDADEARDALRNSMMHTAGVGAGRFIDPIGDLYVNYGSNVRFLRDNVFVIVSAGADSEAFARKIDAALVCGDHGVKRGNRVNVPQVKSAEPGPGGAWIVETDPKVPGYAAFTADPQGGTVYFGTLDCVMARPYRVEMKSSRGE